MSTDQHLRLLSSRNAHALVSTGLSSATNAIVGLAGAALLSADGYGEISLAITVALFAMILCSGFSGEIALVSERQGDPSANTVAVALGLISGVVVATALLAAGALMAASPSLVVVGLIAVLGMPNLALHQCLRLIAFANGRVRDAVFLDLVWLVWLVLCLGMLIVTDTVSVPSYFLAWVSGAGVAAWSFVVLPSPYRLASLAQAGAWARHHWRLGLGITLDEGIRHAASHGVALAVALTFGLVALGGFRFAGLIFGPVTVVAAAFRSRLTPAVAARVRAGSERTLWFALAPGMIAALLVAAYTGIVSLSWSLLELGFDRQVLVIAEPLVHARGVASLSTMIALGATVVLRVHRSAGLLVTARLVNAMLVFSLGVAGLLLVSLEAAVWGMAIANVLALAVWWRLAVRTQAK